MLRCLHAIDATRFHLTMKWVVSFSILRPFGPSRETTTLHAIGQTQFIVASMAWERYAIEQAQ